MTPNPEIERNLGEQPIVSAAVQNWPKTGGLKLDQGSLVCRRHEKGRRISPPAST
jgi:hypothetical protein